MAAIADGNANQPAVHAIRNLKRLAAAFHEKCSISRSVKPITPSSQAANFAVAIEQIQSLRIHASRAERHLKTAAAPPVNASLRTIRAKQPSVNPNGFTSRAIRAARSVEKVARSPIPFGKPTVKLIAGERAARPPQRKPRNPAGQIRTVLWLVANDHIRRRRRVHCLAL
jgi:hypothetical protein